MAPTVRATFFSDGVGRLLLLLKFYEGAERSDEAVTTGQMQNAKGRFHILNPLIFFIYILKKDSFLYE